MRKNYSKGFIKQLSGFKHTKKRKYLSKVEINKNSGSVTHRSPKIRRERINTSGALTQRAPKSNDGF